MSSRIPFQRFHEVTSHLDKFKPSRRFYRSSAPNYDGSYGGKPHDLVEEAALFLAEKRITHIISFNTPPYSDNGLALLADRKIVCKHIPVLDFHAATEDQLQEAIDFVESSPKDAGILIHCAFGRGRTGTGVTALQLYSTNGQYPVEQEWTSVNHVETEEQVELLRRWKEKCHASQA